VHVTPVVRSMIETVAAEVPAVAAAPLRGLLRPRVADRVLDVLGERARVFDPLLHNTASATVLRGGQAVNVIPGEVSVDLDCRLLPGFGPEDAFRELHGLADVEMDLEVLRHDPGPPEPDMTLFRTLGSVLRELDPEAIAVPLLLPAVSDARFFAQLGIQTYGFLPMQLPADMRFMELIHAENERLPIAAMDFGTEAISRLLARLGEATSRQR
jgi:acetylornithine deacetylase/succinyl-diaminopimelate desuccinylase-like protein